LHATYTTVGHVTVDVMQDGSRQPGGAAFYSALQAARLGLRARILTRGEPEELQTLLAPFREEIECQIQPAPQTTTLLTAGEGLQRTQQMLAWAGSIEQEPHLNSAILHLAPVAQEIPMQWSAGDAFVGLTPQGLLRRWSGAARQIELTSASHAAVELAARCNALVISSYERASSAELTESALAHGATVLVTDGAQPNTLLLSGGSSQLLPVPALAVHRQDIGAGDVFAAAFFVALWEGEQPAEAVNFANAAAAVRMSGDGAHAIGDRAALRARMHAVESTAS
jgi:sugar/nucleoside kinase (ribokinase family)